MWLARMQTSSEEPNTNCLNSLIATYVRAGDVAAAKAKLQHMVPGTADGTFADFAVPDAFSYAHVVRALSRAGDLLEAECLLVRAVELGLGNSASAYRDLLLRSARSGDASQAGRLLTRMEALRLPTPQGALMAVLEACAPPFAGLALHALSRLESAAGSREGVTPCEVPKEAYALAARPFAEMGDCDEVDRILARGRITASPEALSLRLIACASVAPLQRRRAMRVAHEAVAGTGLGIHALKILRVALGGRPVASRRSGCGARDPVPVSRAEEACLSRVRAAEDSGDGRLAEEWIRRWGFASLHTKRAPRSRSRAKARVRSLT
eukprot:gnl/TRDRNA2_/TRDRNA2_205538_c0_seq1.p1 gnl/TRDRNA2_/TRDRNA2_205538_c0~~gnl/TRDRNA2_/TRDRNA2_205538_c0_seq1.p1  ORF type:complete len:363 (-),score=53.98 gnl/TRDRNA2_/TRDRNA2_205538_c0_seq1:37-1008(-)